MPAFASRGVSFELSQSQSQPPPGPQDFGSTLHAGGALMPNVASSVARKFGGRWAQSFGSFLSSQELADVLVVGRDGTEYPSHALLLAYHSEFFRRAFNGANGAFKEGAQRRIELGFEDTAGVWPIMLDFFYHDEITLTDEIVLPLLAMSRELMVKSMSEFCSAYASSSLDASNAIHYLNQAVQYSCDSFRESCVALVAEGFPASFNKPTDGLPTEVMLEVLTHPNLVVQTEEQVLTFVLTYIRRHELSVLVIRQLYEHVRLPFLSNERLAALTQEESVPKDMLMAAMAVRFSLLDHPERLQPPSSQAATSHGPAAVTFASQTSSAASVSYFVPSLVPVGFKASSPSSRHNIMPLLPAQLNNPPLSSQHTASSSSSQISAPSRTSSTLSIHVNQAPHPSQSSKGGELLTLESDADTVNVLSGATQGIAVRGVNTFPTGHNQVSSCVVSQSNQGISLNMSVPRSTYICALEYGLPGGSEYACVPLQEVWEDLVPQLHVRVSGDVVEGDAQSILRVHDQESAWFMVSGDSGGQQPVWIEVELPSNMRVVEFTKFTFSHGMNFANHMFPYGISDSQWFQMKGLFVQVSENDQEPLHPLQTSELSSAQQFEYAVVVESGNMPGAAPRTPPWRRLRLSSNEEQSGGSVRLSVRKLRLHGSVEISLIREGPEGARDVLAAWRRRKEAATARGLAAGMGRAVCARA